MENYVARVGLLRSSDRAREVSLRASCCCAAQIGRSPVPSHFSFAVKAITSALPLIDMRLGPCIGSLLGLLLVVVLRWGMTTIMLIEHFDGA